MTLTRARSFRLPTVLVAAFALVGGLLTAAPAYAAGGVTVTVHVTAAGSDLEFASVSLSGLEAEESLSGSTDASGLAVFSDVPADTYGVRVEKADFVSQELELEVTDEDVEQEFALVASDASIHGVVYDQHNEPLEGVWVDVSNDTGGYASLEEATNGTGEFSLSGLGEGDWTVSAYGVEGYDEFTETVTLTAEEDKLFDVHLVATVVGTVEGTIRGSNGRPLKNVYYDFLRPDPENPGEYIGQWGGLTGVDGTFSAEIEPGEDYTIRAYAQSGYWVTAYLGNVVTIDAATTFDLAADQVLDGQDITLPLGGAITAKIVKSTPDGKIDIDPQSWPGPSIWRKVGDEWVPFEILSPYAGNTKGAISVYGLPAGTYRVGFIDTFNDDERAFVSQYWKAKAGFDSATTVTVKAGQTTTLSSTTIIYPKPDWDVEVALDEDIEAAPEVDTTVAEADQGETFSVDVGEEFAGEWVAVTAHSDPAPMSEGWARVDSKGKVRATVDYAVPPGEHTVVVQFANQQVLGSASILVLEDPVPNVFTTKATPTLSGTVAVGATVTAKPGTWKPTPATFSYRWLFNGEVIPDATGPTYVPTPEQLGGKLSVEVSAARIGIVDETVKVSRQSTIGLGTLRSASPTVTGTRKVESLLTAVPGTWTEGTAFTYRWYRDGKPIAGDDNDHEYVQVAADAGKRITVKVTGSLEGYRTASRTSTSKVSATAKGSLGVPTSIAVDGTPAVGSPLAIAYAGDFSPAPVSLAYQWSVGGKPVSGATKSTYTPSASQLGKVVSVKVTGYKTGYSASSVSSLASGPVERGAFSVIPTPVITGAVVGSKAKVSLTGWTPTPTSFSYRWFVGDGVDPVSTSSTYTPTSAQVGTNLRVQLTAKRSGYSDVTVQALAEVAAAP